MTDQLFVSYAHVDMRFVRLLEAKLKENFRVWIDDQLDAGDDWQEAIDDAIRKSFAVIVVISPASSKSKYVTYEWSFAMGLGLPVIPVLLENIPMDNASTDSDLKIHPRLSKFQYLDFTSPFIEPWEPLINRLRKAQQEVPSSFALQAATSLLNMARQQRLEKNLYSALETLEEARRLAVASLLDDIYCEIGVVHLRLGNLDAAETQLKKAFDYNPKNVEILFNLGTVYRRMADREAKQDPSKLEHLLISAQERFLSALELQPELLDSDGESVWGSLGGIYKRLNQVEKAVECYMKAATYMRSSYPYNNLGLLYMERNEFEKMHDNFGLVEIFAQSKVNLSPGDEWAHNDLLVARLVLGKINEARDALSKVRIIAPTYALESLLRTLRQLEKVKGIPKKTVDYLPGVIATIEEKINQSTHES